MSRTGDYSKKFDSFAGRTLYEFLSGADQVFVRAAACELRLTFQEFRELSECCRDLAMWREEPLESLWTKWIAGTQLTGRPLKQHLLKRLRDHLHRLRTEPVEYGDFHPEPLGRPEPEMVVQRSDTAIFGKCPVASDRTICCGLWTLDAVTRCPFGCSYCTIQTFYGDSIVMDAGFQEKLDALSLDPARFYHIGTGQSSDSLAFGNRHGMLDALCRFAAQHSNILLELKTKTDRVNELLRCTVPRNLVVSWSLNPQVIIDAEEHFTSSLDRRLAAAREVADHGIPVAFHFHPMIRYAGWEHGYSGIAQRILGGFSPEEVAFVTFGSVTLIRPVIRKIRERGAPTRILQMEMVPDPHGKITVPDRVKIELFSHMYRLFEPWRDRVFIYLCMEKRSIWEQSFGFAYRDNEEFEAAFARHTMPP